MLFNSLLANITVLLCFFFLFLIIFNNVFMVPVVKENTELKLALAIPTGVLIILVKEAIYLTPLAADKTIKVLLK